MSAFSSAVSMMPMAAVVIPIPIQIPIPIPAVSSPQWLKTRALPPLHCHPSHALLANRLHPSGFSLSRRPCKPTTTTVPFLPKAMATAQELLSQSYVPDCDFYKIEAILRPWRIPHVSSGLLKMGIRGVTVSDVRGFGSQGGLAERHAGSEFSEDKFVVKVKMEIVVSKDQVEAVIDKIIEEARTGEIGDGKIFVIPVSDVIRVRTGERGEKAERMTGGRSDMFGSAISV